MKSVVVNTIYSLGLSFGPLIRRQEVQKTLDYIKKKSKCSLRTCIVDDGNSFNLWIDDCDLHFVRVSSILLQKKKKFMFNSHLICMLRCLIYYSDETFYFAFDTLRRRYLQANTLTQRFQEVVASRYLKDVFNFLYVHRKKWNGKYEEFQKVLCALLKFFSIKTKQELKEFTEILNFNLFKRFLQMGEGLPPQKSNINYKTFSECYNSEMNFNLRTTVGKRKHIGESVESVMENANTYYRSMLGSDKTKIDRDEERAALGLLFFMDNLHNMQTLSCVGKTKMFYYLVNIIKNKRLKSLYFIQMCEDEKSFVVENKMFPIIN